MAETRSYYDYEPDDLVECSKCGWNGPAGSQTELFRELLEITCPNCGASLMVVLFPTIKETRDAAAAGNAKAFAAIADLEAQHARYSQAMAQLLTAPDQLPELAGSLVIEWDFEHVDSAGARDDWTVLRHAGREIWREPAFFEGIDRFVEVFELLVERYGDRLAEVRPTYASLLYLYGDQLRAPATVARLNAGLSDAQPGEQGPVGS